MSSKPYKRDIMILEILFEKYNNIEKLNTYEYKRYFHKVVAQAIVDAKSAFASYLDVALKQGDVIKEPSHLTKTKRINITIPLYALEHIDKYAKSHNINRSTFLVESALKRVGVQ